jgi:ATP-binding cassette subfamily F protein 3
VPDLRDQEARDYLGSFGLGGRLSCEQPLRSLSGGQKARMALALVLAPRPNLLLLDEPTNHFDMETGGGVGGEGGMGMGREHKE